MPTLNNVCVWPKASLTLKLRTLLAATKSDGADPPSRSATRARAAESALPACAALVAVSALPACAADGTCPSVEALICLPVSEPAATFAPVTAPLASLDLFTAAFFNCLVPTLFLGNEVAAYETPPRATNSARYPTTLLRRCWTTRYDMSTSADSGPARYRRAPFHRAAARSTGSSPCKRSSPSPGLNPSGRARAADAPPMASAASACFQQRARRGRRYRIARKQYS